MSMFLRNEGPPHDSSISLPLCMENAFLNQSLMDLSSNNLVYEENLLTILQMLAAAQMDYSKNL